MSNSTTSYKSLFSFVWQFVRLDRFIFSLILLLSFVWAIDATVWPYLFRIMVDIFSKYELERASIWSALKIPVLSSLMLWITIDACFRSQGFLIAKALPRLEAQMRLNMFNHIIHHSPKYFNKEFAGSFGNKIADMTTNVALIMQQLLTQIIPALFGCALSILFFAQLHFLFGIFLGVWMFIHLTICIICARKCGKYESIHGEIRSALLGKIVDSLANNFTVNLFYRFNYEKTQIAQIQKEELARNTQAKRYIEWTRILLGIVTISLGAAPITIWMYHLWVAEALTTGQIVQIFNTLWNITMMLWITGTALPGFFQSLGIAKQALTVMYDPSDLDDAPNAKPLVVSKGEIIFENVSFKFGEKKIFENKNVHIRAGEKVGLVGYSGAGKSTFVNLILRLYPIDSGKILIDGHEIAQVTLESLRNTVALIPQDPLLFHRSLKENILYGKLEANSAELQEVAKLSHADKFINKLPEGYDTLVGERGSKLSGGERQRVVIARALLAKTPILILDEATSALDSITENYIQESLESLMHNRTTIVIAHRLSTLSKMDRILVFDQGRIIEEGRHQELLAQGGHYAKMWRMQAGGFLPETA